MIVRKATLISICLFMMVHVRAIEVTKVTTNFLENPLMVTGIPHLGWQLESELFNDRQTAYQILVSTSVDDLDHDRGTIWNTKKIRSAQSQFIGLKGSALTSGNMYYWKVRVWDRQGKASAWSDVQFWKMAPRFSERTNWIGAISKADSKLPSGRDFHSPELKKKEKAALWNDVDPLAKRSILLRKKINTERMITDAFVYISGLGHYVLTINGRRVGNSEFAPLWSDYDKTVYYNCYRIEKDVLQQGENVVGVMLGNGMYNVSGDRYRKFLISVGPPTLSFMMDIHYADGSQEQVVSDGTWKYSESPITFNCIFGGEDYDATLEQPGWDRPTFDDVSWKQVVIQDAPGGTLRPQLASPVKTMTEFSAKNVLQPSSEIYVFDMGQNLSGYPAIKVQGRKGQKIKLVVGESLTEENLVSQKRTGGPYYFEYTLKGEGVETWHPDFSYYGFQYVQVEGIDWKMSSQQDKPVLLDITSHFIYNSAGTIGSFRCSNELFNKIHELINNAVKSNWQSVFTDCPHREKLGWLEETHLNGPGLLYNYNLLHFIPKIMQDMKDAQRPDGLVPNIAPEYVIFGGDFTDSPEWGVTCAILPWMYYEFYGDASLIKEYYPVMKSYVDYLTSKSADFIVSHGLGDWYDYGDHPAGYSKNSPIPLSATAHYYYGVTLVVKAAGMLGNKEDRMAYQKLAEQIRVAYNKKYFNADTKQYATGSQYANAISLFLGLVPDEHYDAVLDNLVNDVKEHGYRLTTGDVGNRYLYQVLAGNNKNDVMYAMHNHYDTPGYGFQVKFGLTTLTEQWDPRKGNSWNHFMMGQIEEWFYRTLAGIVPEEQTPGFRHFTIKPTPVGDLTFVNASHECLYGTIDVNWKKNKNEFTLAINVPVNTSATVFLPFVDNQEIKMNGKPLMEKKFLHPGKSRDALDIGSGSYLIQYKIVEDQLINK